MAVINVPISNSTIVVGGLLGGPTFIGGHNVYTSGNVAFFNFAMVGTKIEVVAYINSATMFTITVDGGAPSTPTYTADNTFQTITLVSGLSDASHQVEIKYLNDTLYLDSDTGFQITGSAPTTSLATGFAQPYQNNDATWLLYSKSDGNPEFAFVGNYNVEKFVYSGQAVRFRATMTDLKIYCYTGGTHVWVLYQDGVQVATFTMPDTGVWQWNTFATGLSGTHNYELVNIEKQTTYVVQFMLVGTGLITIAPAAKVGAGFMGDSITNDYNRADERTGFPWLVSRYFTYADYCRGVNGAKIADLQLVDGAPKKNIILIGVNDFSNGTNLTTFQNSYVSKLNTLLGTLDSDAKVYCLGILSNSIGDPVAYNLKIAAAVTAVADARVAYTDTTGWIDYVTDTDDGIHPSIAGQAKIAARLETLLTPTSSSSAPSALNSISIGILI